MHLPYVLYHWRSIPGSTAISVDEKGYAKDAARKALQEFWYRKHGAPRIEHIASGHFRTKFSLPDEMPLVSLVIVPFEDQWNKLGPCLNDILAGTDYPNKEILVIATGLNQTRKVQTESSRYGQQVRVLPYSGSFNYSTICNWAVAQAAGSVICLLELGIKPTVKDWLGEMVSQALRAGIGVVGGITLYPDNTIHDAGYMLTSKETVVPLCAGQPKGVTGYANRARLMQNLSIVSTTCVVVTKLVWSNVQGLSSNNGRRLSIIDFCLRVKEKGYRNLWTPYAEFQYCESRDPGLKKDVSNRESDFIEDPAWNPNLTLNGRYTQLATPPRVIKPWRSHDS
jgi:hypothetical protein